MSWPVYDESKTAASSVEMAVQVQGKLRGTVHVPVDSEETAVVEAAKAGFRQEKKRTPITDLKLYVKPEERTAYYVVNETFNGSVAF